MESILTSIKKMLGITEDYEVFDADIVMHINSVFMILNQLGIGPDEVFTIQDKSTVWSEFDTENQYTEAVKSYMYLKVRQLFDPPSTGPLADAMDKQIKELEWRMNVFVDCLQISAKEEASNV